METIEGQNTGSNVSIGSLFQVKTLDSIMKDAEEPEHKLKRALGPVQLTLLGIGAIIGAGIFTTVGTAAAGDLAGRKGAGPALVVSFVITAVVCAFTALCYSEFAAMVPISGSAYTYSYATLGEVVAWIIGWDLVIEYAVGNIAVAISWAGYFKTFMAGFGINIPDWLCTDYRTAKATPSILEHAPHLFGHPIVFNFIAIAIVALITIILIWGIRESARFNAVMVGLKIIILTFFVVVGALWVKPTNWTPFAPNHWAGISAGAAIVFFAYIGFDAVSTVAEETREPQRNMPIGIFASLIICTIFYIAVSAVFTGLIPFTKLLGTTQADPLTAALNYAMPAGSQISRISIAVVGLGSLIAQAAVLLVFQLGQPRIFFSMARDGLLPPLFYKVHPKFRTPWISTILTGVFVAGFAAVASLDEMVDLTNIGTLFAFILVCAGIIVLKKKDPNRPRPFTVPSGWKWTIPLYILFAVGVFLFQLPIVWTVILLVVVAAIFALCRNHIFPVLGIISCLYLIYFLPPTSWLRFAAWLNLGFVIFVGYGSVHSRLTGRVPTEVDHAHKARTAYSGALLAVIGAFLLFFMRSFDVWLQALKTHEALTGGAKYGAAFSDIFTSGPWLELSWFLVVPLALNAFVLCPIVIRRAIAARKGSDSAAYSGQTSASLAIATILGLASIVYLVVVVIAHINGHPSVL